MITDCQCNGHDDRPVQAERDDQGSKVSDFFAKSEDMFVEMNWQKKLRKTNLNKLRKLENKNLRS